VNGKLKELWKRVSEDAEVKFYDITSTDGIRTYERGLLFLFIKSVHDVFNKSEVSGVKCEYSLGNGVLCEIEGSIEINDEFVEKVRNRMDELVEEDIMFEKSMVSTKEAVEKFYQLFYTISVNLSCFNIHIVALGMNISHELIAFLLMMAGNHKITKDVCVLCNLKSTYCCHTACAYHQNTSLIFLTLTIATFCSTAIVLVL